jgi:DNA-binding phage protein
MKKRETYKQELTESVRDPSEAEEYFNAALEEGDPELFFVALRNAAEAQGGVAQVADKTKLNRKASRRCSRDVGTPREKTSMSYCMP